DSVLYFDPLDPEAIASAILRGTGGVPAEEEAAYREAAVRRSLCYDWSDTARALTAVLEEAAGCRVR
ncbi:MAG TPA: hypothetical protein VH660_06195, partial [Candidatus Deferrimicrobiaceae bacterium]